MSWLVRMLRGTGLCVAVIVAVGGCKGNTETALEKIEKHKKSEENRAKGPVALPGEQSLLSGAAKPPEATGPKVGDDTGCVARGETTVPFFDDDAISVNPLIKEAILELKKTTTVTGVIERLKDKGPEVPSALSRALWHMNPNVRSMSSQVIVKMELQSDEITTAFRRALRMEPDKDTRAIFAKAQVDLKDKRLTTTLIELLDKDQSPDVQANAAYALGAIRDPAAVDALVKATNSSTTWVRLRSVTALRRIGAKRAAPALVEKLKDGNDLVRKDAVKALQEITGKKIGEDYSKWKAAVK